MQTQFINKTKSIIFSIIFIMVTVSCKDKIVDIELPKDATKLAVFGFLSADDTVTNIYVKNTSPIYTQKKPSVVVGNAVVKITNNNKEYILPFDKEKNAYSLHKNKLKIVGGETYTLKVSASGYDDVSSTITIIKDVNKTLEFVSFYKEKKNYEEKIKIGVKWKDDESKKNYYVLRMNIDEDKTNDHYDTYSYSHVYFYKDANWNGKEKYSNDLYFSYEEGLQKKNITVALINADEHYYLYHKKANEFYQFGENPFSEPVLVYSNINNGVGVFCSYSKCVVNVEWKEE